MPMKSPCRILLLACLVLAAPAAIRADDAAPPPAVTDTAPRYPFHGVIKGLFPEKGMLLIKHDEVTGLMKGTTMGFRVQPEIFKQVKNGQTIDATLVVREDDFYLENIKVVKH